MTWFNTVIISLSLQIIFISFSFTQKDFIKSYDSLQVISNLDSLRKAFGAEKEFIDEIEAPALVALSYFPELINTKISFKYARIKTTMNARPTLVSLLFRKKEKYAFIVRINSIKKDSVISIQDTPFNAKIGILGHEFCHFIDYLEGGFFRVIKRGFDYTNSKKKSQFEKEIDKKTIERGLGWLMYDWELYVQEGSNASVEYKKFKRETYMTPQEILDYIKKTQW